MERLKRHNVVVLQDMEKLIKIMAKKYKDLTLVAAVSKELDNKKLIKSVSDL